MKRLFFSLLLILSSLCFANINAAGEDCDGECNSSQSLNSVIPASSSSSAGELTNVMRGIASNIEVVDEDFIETACIHIENGSYDNFIGLINRYDLKLEDIYLSINCESVDFSGRTIMHTVLETNLGLLDFAERLLELIRIAKSQNSGLDTASFFNSLAESGSSYDKTVLDLIIKYKRISANNPIILQKLEEVEVVIVELGGKTSLQLAQGNSASQVTSI